MSMDSSTDLRSPTLGLYLKLAAVMVPTFLIFAGAGLLWLSERNLLRSEETMAMRIGNTTARVGGALERFSDLSTDEVDWSSPYVGDLMQTLLGDPAVRCAELLDPENNNVLVKVPPGLGCRGSDDALTLPYEVFSRPMTRLVTRFDEREIATVKRYQHDFLLLLLAGGILIATLANWVSFRIIVGRPLRQMIERLEEARATAETANASKSEFLAKMSHEIRTPMNGILGMADMLTETDLNREQNSYLSTIVRSGDALLTIINDILDFSKIEADKLVLSNEPFQLREVVEDVTQILAPLAARKGLALFSDVSPGLPEVILGDAGRLRQILINVAGNAVKFTLEGHVSIRVRSGGPDRFIICITDTGVGIPANQIGHVFKAFEQANNAATRKFGGTGLGLAVSRQLAELMGGKIEVTSQERVGTQFDIQLPLVPKDTGECGLSVGPLRAPGAPAPRVWLIDPLPERRAGLTGILTHLGCDLVDADNAASLNGIEKATDLHKLPALLILDESSALEKTLPQDVPCIVMCEKTMADKPGQAFLRKPVREDALIETARRLMGGANQDLLPTTAANVATRPAKASDSISQIKNWALGLSVLVVDDNATNRLLLERYLATSGANLRVAQDGQQAVALYREDPADFVLMDVSMPVMDGYQATGLIRLYENENGLPTAHIVATTANVLDQDKQQAQLAGMDGFLGKPLRKADLIRYVTALYGDRDPAEARPA